MSCGEWSTLAKRTDGLVSPVERLVETDALDPVDLRYVEKSVDCRRYAVARISTKFLYQEHFKFHDFNGTKQYLMKMHIDFDKMLSDHSAKGTKKRTLFMNGAALDI